MKFVSFFIIVSIKKPGYGHTLHCIQDLEKSGHILFHLPCWSMSGWGFWDCCGRQYMQLVKTIHKRFLLKKTLSFLYWYAYLKKFVLHGHSGISKISKTTLHWHSQKTHAPCELVPYCYILPKDPFVHSCIYPQQHYMTKDITWNK